MLADLKLHTRINQSLVAHRSGRFNLWFVGDYAELYLRCGTRYFPALKSYKATLEVANITVTEKSRGSGVLTALLDHLEAKPFAVYVENVLEPRLEGFLVTKRGYTSAGGDPPSFYRLPEPK